MTLLAKLSGCQCRGLVFVTNYLDRPVRPDHKAGHAQAGALRSLHGATNLGLSECDGAGHRTTSSKSGVLRSVRQISPHGSARFFECKKCQPHSKPVALLWRSIAHRHRSDRAGCADAACIGPEFSGESAARRSHFLKEPPRRAVTIVPYARGVKVWKAAMSPYKKEEIFSSLYVAQGTMVTLVY